MSEWIKVKDRMPEQCTNVIVFSKRVSAGFWIEIGGKKMHVIFGDRGHESKFTHWMPLPNPPKDGQ